MFHHLSVEDQIRSPYQYLTSIVCKCWIIGKKVFAYVINKFPMRRLYQIIPVGFKCNHQGPEKRQNRRHWDPGDRLGRLSHKIKNVGIWELEGPLKKSFPSDHTGSTDMPHPSVRFLTSKPARGSISVWNNQVCDTLIQKVWRVCLSTPLLPLTLELGLQLWWTGQSSCLILAVWIVLFHWGRRQHRKKEGSDEGTQYCPH